MKFILDAPGAGNQIIGFAPGEVKINDQIYIRSVLVTPEQIVEWKPQSFADLKRETLHQLLEYKPEVVLLGTGIEQCFLPEDFLIPFISQGVGIEVMTTSAACRTYNVLMSEDRKVLAALLLR